jgi:carboxymethylenebutenolidase
MALWNQFRTDAYQGLTAETEMMAGHNGDLVHAYVAKPLGPGPFPGVVLINHLPGWDELYREFARRFAFHGYITVAPNIFDRFGQGSPDDIAAKARGEGGVPDASVIGDALAANKLIKAMPNSNGKVGVIGTCSGGRHAYLVAAKTQAFDAIVNCWGGRTVMKPEELTPAQPESPASLTRDLNCPVLGLFGNDDQNPNPEMVNQIEAELKQHNKRYEFHRYDGAGHAFWYYDRPAYRPEAAMDAWNKVFTFFEQNLS